MKYNKFLPNILFPFFLMILLMPLLTGHYYPKWDASDMGYPSFAYLSDSIRGGRFPLWDPYTDCGYPYHADPAQLTLNPLAILLGLLISNSSTGFVLLWFLYWCWAGLGMIWLAKNFGATPLGALLAAIAFSLSGFFIGHAEHTGFILTAAWFPWIIGLADKAVKESSTGYALLAGAATGFCCLGGYPGLIAVFGFALLLWLALRYISIGSASSDNSLKRLLWIFITLGVIGIVMLAVWSPVLNAFFTEGKGYTERVSQLEPHLANFGYPFPLTALVSLFFPFATFIFPSLVNADVSMTNGYVGMLTIPFAVLWLIKGGEAGDGRRRTWWLFVFAIFMFILSLGGQAGLRTILYYIYPPVRFVRFSAPFRVFWILPVSFAAGLGFSHLQKHPEDRALMFKIFLGWVAVGLCVGIAVAIACSSDQIPMREVFSYLYLPAIITVALAVPLFWLWLKNRQGFLYRLAPVLILTVAAADMSMHLYNNSYTVFTKNNVISRVESMRVGSTHVDGEPGPRQPGKMLGFMNVQQVLKIFVAPGYVTMKSKGFDDVLLNSRFIEVMSAPYRFWLSPGVTPIESRDSALSVLANTGGNEPVPVFIEDATVPLPAAMAVPGSFGDTRIISYDPEKIEMEVDVPAGPGGFLASTERYSAGWKAFVDGVEQRVYKSDLYFRGIYLPAGRHSVIWKYEPHLWRQLVLFSMASLLISATGGWYLIRKKRRQGERVRS